MPEEERRFRDAPDKNFGDQGDQAKICTDIMQRTGARIEISSSKDLSLTILITGKSDAVVKARRAIVNELQTQVYPVLSQLFLGGLIFANYSCILSG